MMTSSGTRSGAAHMEDSVLIDHRTYRIRPGMVAAHLGLYEKHGLGPQTRHIGPPVAYMFAESGDLNTVVHIWAYEDAADRAAKRAKMAADADWQHYLKLNSESGFLLEQKNCLMLPAAFAPIKR